MKYGVVYYKETDNIGDDIQNYAVMQFLPKVDYLIDREDLAGFASEGNEPVAVVLNGWYMHNKYNWPPSKDIIPLCTSMHFSPNDYLNVGYDFLDGIGGEYLKNYEPIGCRDSNTLKVLQEKGIESYLSGCVTLTLPRREKKRLEKEYVCVVDVPDGVEQRVAEELADSDIELKKLTHWVDYKNEPLPWEKRVEYVESLLDTYQNAKCVVTKRLHCALPCLAMGTPVLLIFDEEKDDVTRYSFFTELLHVMSSQAFMEGKGNYNIKTPLANKDAYIAKKNSLVNKITEFVSNVSSENSHPKYEIWRKKEEVSIKTWRMDLLKRIAQYASKHIDEILTEKNRLSAITYAEIQQLSVQYEVDTGVLNQVISDKSVEIERLEGVIIEKSEEEQRLNNVIIEKNKEEQHLNNVIAEKNEEEKRLNFIIEEANNENERKNIIINKKNEEIMQLRPVYEYVQELRKRSVIWWLCFEEQFKNASVREKIMYIYEVIKNKSKK